VTRAELVQHFEALPGAVLRLDEPVSRHSALRIGGEVEAWVLALDEPGLLDAMSALRAASLKLRHSEPLGDHFAREEGLAGAMIRLGPAFEGLELDEGVLRVGAAVPLARLGAFAMRHGLEAWAPLASWPGTLGAWLRGGDPVALEPLLRSVRVLKGRSLGDKKPKALGSLGAAGLILGAKLLARHDAALPPPPPAPGSVLVREPSHESAMRQSRLPGLRLRSIRLAGEQTGLVVNLGGGSSRDLDLVLRLVRDRLSRDHGLDVEPRLQPLGRPPKPPTPERGVWP
jgi:UDP-N-acetylenolpyruvoylglucosamine reductase